MNRKIILASASRQRKMLMDSLNIPYIVIPAEIDEKSIRDKDYSVMAEKIARAKAEKVLSENSDAIIIAGDSFTVLSDGTSLEKPVTIEEAEDMMKKESGAKGTVYAGFCYIDKKNDINFSKTSVTTFKNRKFSKKEIDSYTKKYPVTTWAGGLSPAYPYGLTFVYSINGSITGFAHGFPIELVIEYLSKSGIEPRP